ncbi:type II secretion system protein GspM [Variovorax sp. PvP013]|jgi:general secretion pathway protein M|uniref:type II secretion system protein GspM n=1 Tax=Variovorax sp. PvP013 TaxID=3156435 RepID=UPI003D1D7D0B
MSALQTFGTRARTWWRGLPAREQRLVGIAGVVIALALVWWVGLAPALRTLSTARLAHAQLDVQLQQMLALQAQARALQALPRANRDDALRALETSVNEGLGGSVRMQTAGASATEGVLVTLRATPASNFAQWLTQARGNARALPREIHVTRSQAPAGGVATTPGAGGPVGFSGLPPGAAAGPGSRTPPPPGGSVPAAGRSGPSTGRPVPTAGAPASASASVGAEALGARWDGTIVMSLPAR